MTFIELLQSVPD